MKKLNLLTRSQLKEVMGGVAASGSDEPETSGGCYIKVQVPGATYYHTSFFVGSCLQQQALANSECLNQLSGASKGANCYYDCACDGIASYWAKKLT